MCRYVLYEDLKKKIFLSLVYRMEIFYLPKGPSQGCLKMDKEVYLNSFKINLLSFSSFICPLFHKQETDKAFF